MSTPKTEPSSKKAFNFPKSTVAKKRSLPVKAESNTEEIVTASTAVKKATKASVAKKAAGGRKSRTGTQKDETIAAQPATSAPESSASTGAVKTKRTKKEKVVRDSFTMPKADYAKIASLKKKCLDNGLRVKKSELLRAALAMLDAATDKRIVAAIKSLETVKTGRPASA
ncbi:hypothetical protein AWB80_03910 [Caballeronia pedi]|uniref:Uncharacterized protein n=1 Tax=Caballeronia pedi TaxID=1777141 RepID=A0A158BPV1_9BURK|nr:hypothetical protein [Caballeronia pedi]SAK72073.1 hypothetical protein AWB80_03910 [Caballeronia pedi]